MTSKSVLIGTVTSDAKRYCLDKFIDGINSIDYDNFRHIVIDTSDDPAYRQELFSKGVWSLPGIPSTTRDAKITDGLNKIRELAIIANFDYMLIVDSDWVVKPDIITRLVTHDKDMVSGVVKLNSKYTGVYTTVNCFWYPGIDPELAMKAGIFVPKWLEESKIGTGLIEWIGGGVGAALISRKLLMATPFIHFKFPFDTYYAELIRNIGFKQFIDTDVLVDHYPDYAQEGLLWQKSKTCSIQRNVLTA